MEAIGKEVIVALLPLLTLISLVIYLNWEAIILNINILRGRNQQAAPAPQAHPLFGNGQCCICLDDPKKFQVAATCGHSFCGQCLMDIFLRDRHTKMTCPLCRKEITTIFKTNWAEGGDAVIRQKVIKLIQEYNGRFDDNRSWVRRVQQFPYVFKRIARYLLNPIFWALFLRSLYFIRIIMFSIVYIILPFDLIPEKLLGFIGLIDDFLIFFVLLAIAVSTFALVFLRRQQH